MAKLENAETIAILIRTLTNHNQTRRELHEIISKLTKGLEDITNERNYWKGLYIEFAQKD